MPRVPQTASSSLKELCLKSITDKIDSHWCKHFLQYHKGTTQFFYVLGPFDELPPNLIHDIWLCLKTRKLLRRHHGFLLISPFFSKLDLSYSETDFNLFLHLATQRCFMLTQLSLSHNKLSRDLITKTLPSFTKLTSLSMSYSNVTDNQVSIIGLYMSNLTSLDVSFCTQVSDHGLLTLVLGQDVSGASDTRFGQCKKLSTLLVSGCQNVSSHSVTTLLLNLNLSMFDFCDTVGVIHQLICDDKLNKTLLLKSLYCGESCTQESLPLVIGACPRVEHVFMVLNDQVTCQALYSLLDIKYLRELHIREESGTSGDDLDLVTLNDVLTPVLVNHGATLVSVNLAETKNIDVASLCSHCPNLVHLALHWNKSYVLDSNHSSRREWFPALKTVDLSFVEHNDDNYLPSELSFDHLLLILRSPLLKSIKICQSRNFTDQCFENIFSLNSLRHLEHLELTKCDEICFISLEILLEQENCLTNVKLVKCEQVTRRDIQSYQKKIKKWKWKLNLEWS